MSTLLAPSLPVFETLRGAPAPAALPDTPVNIPSALVRPLETLFNDSPPRRGENFLSGLRAVALLGAGALPVAGRRRALLAWIGVLLRAGPRRLFDELRGGCWVRGFPAVGRGRLLLQAADIGSPAALGAALRELGMTDEPGEAIYLSFHHAGANEACERVYALDAGRGRLHAFALPALTPASHLGACAACF